MSVQCKGCGEVSVSVSVRHVYSFFFNCILILLTSTIRGVYIKKVRKKSSYFFLRTFDFADTRLHKKTSYIKNIILLYFLSHI